MSSADEAEAANRANMPPDTLQQALGSYLDEVGHAVREEVLRLVRERADVGGLSALLLDYPGRRAKALRPALCLATSAALGGRATDLLPTAAVLELFHNAFLIHDDIEDESLMRRGSPTLHRLHGVATAVHAGDALLALTLQPLLDNSAILGLGRALEILRVIARMSRESVEGQALELSWIRHRRWDLTDRDYLYMVYKKTGWYTFIAPILIGAIAAGARSAQRSLLGRFAALLGIAFQIQDDLLNLDGQGEVYGKELGGDLAEGKRTLMILHVMRCASEVDRGEAERILGRSRAEKSDEDIARLMDLVRKHGSLAYARCVAMRYAAGAARALDRLSPRLLPSKEHEFLRLLVDYVVRRER